MTVNSPSIDTYTDFQGLSQLRQKAGADAPDALQEVGKHFEALFIQMMLQSMREASPGDPLFAGKEEELYRDLFDKQLSMTMASQGNLGLADIIVRQLRGNSKLQDSADKSAAQTTPQVVSTASQIRSRPNDAHDNNSYLSPSTFVKSILPYARKAAEQLNVDPQVLIAQAALETGWGRGIIHHSDGRSSNNLFGIKAGGDWKNETVSVQTLEFRDGVAVKERATFRSYDSLASSFQDYVQFLQNNPRYKEALVHAGDTQLFSNALQESGYATDPQYAVKIHNILSGDILASAISGLKVSATNPIG